MKYEEYLIDDDDHYPIVNSIDKLRGKRAFVSFRACTGTVGGIVEYRNGFDNEGRECMVDIHECEVCGDIAFAGFVVSMQDALSLWSSGYSHLSVFPGTIDEFSDLQEHERVRTLLARNFRKHIKRREDYEHLLDELEDELLTSRGRLLLNVTAIRR